MWHFLAGYVIIRIEGLSASLLLRRMSKSGVCISDLKRVDEGTLQCTIPVRQFRSLRKLRKGLRLRIRIIKRGGLPFFVRKVYRRPVLWAGSAVLLTALFVLSARIWLIRIDETERIDPKEITELLDEYGIRPGARLIGPVLITAADDLSARIHDAARIWIERDGVLLHVHVAESIPETPKKNDRVPSDVIADKDGTVLSVQVMRGQARVKPGDRVKAGDVLISGTVSYKDETYDTNADGTVTAAVLYETEAAIPDSVTEARETENTEQVRILRLASKELMRTCPAFEHYRLTDAYTAAVSKLLPVFVDKYTAHEIVFVERVPDPEEAEQLALCSAREAAYALVPKDAAILNTYGTFRKKDGTRKAVVIVTAEETIGKTEERLHGG